MKNLAIENLPALSVVIIGRNEGQRLARCLASVRAMRGVTGTIEIIYVDSASTDDSVRLAQSYHAQVIVLSDERPTAARGRNAGWRAACAPFVLFLDGDTILDPDFAACALPHFANDKVAVVCGQRREIAPGNSVYNRVLDLDWVFQKGEAAYCGGDALMRRAVLQELDGYDASLIAGEEPDLCCRMRLRGYVILQTGEPMTGHDLAITRCSQYWRRAVRTGYAYAQVARRFRHTAQPLWSAEVKHNFTRGGALAGLLCASLASAWLLQALWPLAFAFFMFATLVLRTALKTRWKAPQFTTRLLYGAHSHLQQIPILIGQFLFWRDQWMQRRRALIEYK